MSMGPDGTGGFQNFGPIITRNTGLQEIFLIEIFKGVFSFWNFHTLRK